MAQPYTPVGRDINNEDVRRSREADYALEPSEGALRTLGKYLDFFVETSCDPPEHYKVPGGMLRAYSQTFIEVMDTSDNDLVTELDIEITRPNRRAGEFFPRDLVAAYSVWLWQEDAYDEVLADEEYRLRLYKDGDMTLSIRSSMDGLADRLLDEAGEDRPESGWRTASEYEIRGLIGRLRRQQLPEQDLAEPAL